MRQVDNKTKVKKMNDIVHYDEFKKGDRVWSAEYGFGVVDEYGDGKFESESRENPHFWVKMSPDGCNPDLPSRGRKFFYAIYESDKEMRAAIARGEGRRRPAPRGRWPIQPGDTVIYLDQRGVFVGVAKAPARVTGRIGVINKDEYKSYINDGRAEIESAFPSAMRLYAGENPPANTAEALILFGKAMAEEKWEEKYK